MCISEVVGSHVTSIECGETYVCVKTSIGSELNIKAVGHGEVWINVDPDQESVNEYFEKVICEVDFDEDDSVPTVVTIKFHDGTEITIRSCGREEHWIELLSA